MSENIQQIYVANPTTAMVTNDLLYLGRSPYGASDDFAITWNNMQLSITGVGTIAAGIWQGTTVGIAYGGTGLTSVTTAPTAGAFAGWDTNRNLSADSFISGFTSIATAAATTTLTVNSTYIQEFTGSTTQTVVLPVTSTLVAGQGFYIINNSSGAVTVQSSGANNVQVMAASTSLYVTCVATSGTTAASWQSAYIVDNGLAGAVLLNPAGDQAIINGFLQVAAGVVISGATAGGTVGGFRAYPTTATTGYSEFNATPNSGNFGNVLTNAATSAPRTWTLPNDTGTIALTASSTQSFAGDSGTATPLAGVITFTGSPTGLTFSAASSTVTLTGTLVVGNGGTGVTSVTTSPTATAFAGWNAQRNMSADSFIPGFATTATAAATTTLTVDSVYTQEFTGSTTQTVVMPVTSTLVAGQAFYIINNSSGIVTVQSSGANTIQAMNGGSSLLLTCVSTSGTTAASWQASYLVDSAGVSSITGTANQVIASASVGAVTLSLPQDIATTSNPLFASVTTNGNLTANSGNAFISISPTANLGQLVVGASNNGANYNNILTNASTTGARTWLLPDLAGTLAVNIDGTFTPTLAFGGGSTGITYSNQYGLYTRVGNMVTIYIYLILTSKGTDVGAATIGGMPFSARTPTGNPPFPIYCENITFVGNPVPFMTGSTMILGEARTATSFLQWDNTNFVDTSAVIISGSYLI